MDWLLIHTCIYLKFRRRNAKWKIIFSLLFFPEKLYTLGFSWSSFVSLIGGGMCASTCTRLPLNCCFRVCISLWFYIQTQVTCWFMICFDYKKKEKHKITYIYVLLLRLSSIRVNVMERVRQVATQGVYCRSIVVKCANSKSTVSFSLNNSNVYISFSCNVIVN